MNGYRITVAFLDTINITPHSQLGRSQFKGSGIGNDLTIVDILSAAGNYKASCTQSLI